MKDLCKKEATDVASYLAVMNEAVSVQQGMKRNVSLGLSVVKGGKLGKRTRRRRDLAALRLRRRSLAKF